MGNLVIGNNNHVPKDVNVVALGVSDRTFTDDDEGKVFIGENITIDENGVLQGPVSPEVNATQTSAFIAGNKKVYPCDATSGALSVTLMGTLTEQVFIKVDSTGNTVDLTPNTGTINGLASYSLTSQYQKVTVIFDGTNYYV